MEIFKAGIDLIKSIVSTIGGSMVIIGLIGLFQSFSENNAERRQSGMALLVGGAGIALLGQTLIPMLGNGF